MRRLLPLLLAACAAPAPLDSPAVSGVPGAPLAPTEALLDLVAPAPFSFELGSQEPPSWAGPALVHVAASLALQAPLDAPVRIEVLDLSDRWGQAWWDEEEGLYRIQLDASIPGPRPDWAIDVLVHEWAHCLVWGAASWEDPHGPLWGVSYARCYRAAVDPGSAAQAPPAAPGEPGSGGWRCCAD